MPVNSAVTNASSFLISSLLSSDFFATTPLSSSSPSG
jgi:hypothetical protein